MEPPCKDCEKRYLGCHSDCESYKAYRADREADYEKRMNRRRLSDALDDLGKHRCKARSQSDGLNHYRGAKRRNDKE